MIRDPCSVIRGPAIVDNYRQLSAIPSQLATIGDNLSTIFRQLAQLWSNLGPNFDQMLDSKLEPQIGPKFGIGTNFKRLYLGNQKELEKK